MRIKTIVMMALAALLVLGGNALAERPPGAGSGGAGGGGGNGDGGGEITDFGDLFMLYRNDSGVPILDGNLCQQPIAFPSETCVNDGVTTCYADLGDVSVVLVDPATCTVPSACASCTSEVDFGRSNAARSPVSVFEAQLEDVVTKLATADCILLDPAGRLVAQTIVDEATILNTTIDSPLQNLAMYRELVMNGTLGVDLPVDIDLYDTAARGVGVSNDKTGEVNVDMVVYLNQIMGLSDPAVPTIFDPKICQDNREEVKGVVQLVEKCFLNYGSFGYDRATNFDSLPSPAYIPASDPTDGWFEYLEFSGNDPDGNPLFEIIQASSYDTVFGAPGFVDGNIGGFTQLADDTRAVIEFMHSHPLPLGYETPIPQGCEPSGEDRYDVYISDISGLQVPVRMVAGTEGREFTLTVANYGPDFATGIVTLTAEDTDGIDIFTPKTLDFELVGGASQSFTEFFSIDYKTTITWTAAATPDCLECEVNWANNTVTEETTVIGGGGGGGSGKR